MKFEEALKAMREGKMVNLAPDEPRDGNWRENVHIKNNKIYMDSYSYSYPVIAKLTNTDILSEKWEIVNE